LIVLIGFSIFSLYYTSQIREVKGAVSSARFFPYIVICGIISFSIIDLWNVLSKNNDFYKKPFLIKSEVVAVFVTFLTFIVYIFLLKPLGFIVSTAIFLSALSNFYYYNNKSNKNILKNIVISIIVSWLLFKVFNDYFRVLLP